MNERALASLQRNPYSSRAMLYTAFAQKGYGVEELRIGTEEYTRFKSPVGKIWFTDATYITYPMLDASVVTLARQKDISSRLVESLGVSTPKTVYGLGPDAESLLNSAQRVIMKPIDSSAARGLTMDITTKSQFEAAAETVRSFSEKEVMVQQQVTGDEIRFVVMDYETKIALFRQTPRVTGDGTRSVRQLIEAENKARAGLRLEHITYPQLTDALIDSAYMTSTLVPKSGEIVELGRGSMVKTGASIYNIFSTVHASYLEIASRIAKALGASFLVVDLIVKDYEKPAEPDNYWFLELNAAPALRLFYADRDGHHADIVPELVSLIDRTIH